MFCTLMNNHQRFTNYFKMYLLFPFKNRKKKGIRFLPQNDKTGSHDTSHDTSLWENLDTVCWTIAEMSIKTPSMNE